MANDACLSESDVTIPAVSLSLNDAATLSNHMVANPDLRGRIASRGNAVGASCSSSTSCRGYRVAVDCSSDVCTCNEPWFVPEGSGCKRGVCYNINCDFVWTCKQTFPTVSPVCLSTRDASGCCEGCAEGLIDASDSFVATYNDARTILDRIATFTPTEQGLINSLFVGPLNSTKDAFLLSNMVALFDMLFDDGLDPCTFGKGVATGVWNIHDTAVSLLALLDDPTHPPLNDPEDRKRIDEYRKKMLWIKNCMLPKFLERKGLKCFKDDDCSGGVCKDDCSACVQCRTNNDCTDPIKPNCINNGAGIMVCGDPHISQTIPGADHRRLCYDFVGKPGSEYLFLRDHEIGRNTIF
ncbi:unnamed protein product [Owenia fusiformis]|uniref:Uncharacterized protein n=1 Tax=Owenia fusiformis TaxID=6347 RepID=A0A8J1XKK6_OWEFU|nr:unnamed protein product [Owenia fusiformis]